jgi:hypothetical protein
VKLYSNFVHTARHALEVDQIENEKNKLLKLKHRFDRREIQF